MAVIFEPHGPLSLPCENTTVWSDRVISSPVLPPRGIQVIRAPCRYREMALEEEAASAAQELRPAIEALAECNHFAQLDRPTLAALAEGSVQFSLPAGGILFELGAVPDGVYLVVSGKLGLKMLGQPAVGHWNAEIGRGELVGESGWLLQEPRSAKAVALRDCEILHLPNAVLDLVAARSTAFSLAIARLSAQRLRRSGQPGAKRPARARVIVIVPNSMEIDVLHMATLLVGELSQAGTAELVWDVRASTHTSAWFNGIEEKNDFVVYVADPVASGWTRQCCRQADVVLLAAQARSDIQPWPPDVVGVAAGRGTRIELALLHDGTFATDAAARWLAQTPVRMHHHLVDVHDYGRLARLLTRSGVALVLSGGGARGFAHLGIIRALREARVPIDFVGGSSIGAIIAAGVAMGWSDEEMRLRYHRSFVASNPVNDYTFPRVALTRGRKVSHRLEREYSEISIEDLRVPFFCVSANLTTGKAMEHRAGRLSDALRASVAIPGVMPPVYSGEAVLVDGAAINNLPVDIMQAHAPGLVVGCDVGADRNFDAKQRINIIQILMHAGMVNSAAAAAAQRELADVLFKPPLANIDLLNWQAFDRAIAAGYGYARAALERLPDIPRLAAAPAPISSSKSSLAAALDQRLAAKSAAG